MRRRLPAGVKMYSGDDFHYPELIRGDEQGYSHALPDIFNAVAPAASAALQALDQDDRFILHLSELFILADKARLWRDPALAVHRMRTVLALTGLV